VPAYELDASLFSDWGDPREFTMGDLGIGECAGEVISRTDLELSIAESLSFESQLALEDGDLARADEKSYQALIAGARAMVALELPILPREDDDVVREFQERFYDTKVFFDRFAQGKFARPLFARHESGPVAGADAARELVEEAQLFIDAAHACQIRVAEARSLEVVA